MMWFLLLLLCTAHNQLIVQGEERTILLNGRNPCEGYIGIYHNSILGYVGGTNWTENNGKVVCKSINCGDFNESSSMPAPGDIDKVWIDEVKCKGIENNLWDCTFPGWAVIPSKKDSLQKITCSHKINIALDESRCAGAVQYSTDGGNKYSGYFCAANWDKTAADLLCETLKCGTSKEIVKQRWMGLQGVKEKSEMMKDCLGTATHLWQCAQPQKNRCDPASVICTDHERVQLKPDSSNVCSGALQKEENGVWNPVQNSKTNPDNLCKQMHCGSSNSSNSQGDKGSNLTCSDDVKVVLMVNKKHTSCYGSVYVEVNGISQPVCGSDWNKEAAKVVCSELKCGSVFSNTSKPSNTRGIMDYVSCSGDEASLWHCRAKRDNNNNPLSCTTAAYVVCADSIGVRLIDGPGKCAGRLEIQHEDTWRRVDKELFKIDSIGFVCGQLDCGKKGKSVEKQFSQGSANFLDYTVECENKATGISDCLKKIDKEINKPKEEKKAKAIICDEHKMVFLAESCSGMVGIAQGDQISWLSGSNTTWNKESANTVCQQMQCGNASHVTSMSNANMTKSIWQESYNCSSIKESLFNCEKIEPLPSDHNNTIATVTCSGKISVDFPDKVCWGTVRVCLNNTCGGVCADTWTDEKSKMLCKDLGCGKALKPTGEPKQSLANFSSLHSTKETTSLTQCIFVRRNVSVKPCDTAYVVCSDSVKPELNDPRDKCSGNVVVHYEDKRLPVCADALEDDNIKTICEELDCGEAGKKITYFGPEAAAAQLSITKIQCSANKSFGECTIEHKQSSCKAGALQCSGWKKMALARGKACSGVAMVHSEGKKSAIAFEGWTETMGKKLCKYLECGQLNNYTKTNFWSHSNTSFSCPEEGDPNIWKCEKVSPSNESQSKPQLLIECEGEPTVTLSKTQYGNVTIDGTEVCDINWKENYSHMVCGQNHGSKAIAKTSHNEKPIAKKRYYHVSCEANHYTLGQCKRARRACKGNLVSVYCVGNAEFNTTEKCGGQIEVNYRDKWEKVCPLTSFTNTHFEKLCEQLGCGRHKRMESKHNDTVSLETSLSCTAANLDIKHCLSHQSCEGKRPAEIYCDGYEDKPLPPPIPMRTPSIWREMLVVGFALVLLILIVVFIRICTVKNAKKSSNDLPGTLSRKEVEIESGSYDDVMSKSNEMEELNRGGLRSESEVVMENDAPSTSSCPYDDIDDPAAAQPLISRATTAGASGGDCIQNGATYEVDDQQENHEDIEASPEITWTEAEVHDSTQTTPESDAAAPLGSVQGD